MKLQDRLFFAKVSRSFSISLMALLAIFFLIDYAFQAKGLLEETPGMILRYYTSRVSSFANILFPFAFLLAILFVLIDLNNKRQWVALQACKITPLMMLRPFILVALLLTLLLWTNSQWLSPLVTYTSGKERSEGSFGLQTNKVHSLRLKDDSLLFFHHFDTEKQTLHDIFWLPDSRSLWHIDTLHIDHTPPIAKSAKQLIQDEMNRYQLIQTYETLTLDQFCLELPEESDELLDMKVQPLTLLYKKATLFPKNDHQAKATSAFLNKLLMPLLPLLLLLAAAPSALRFSKVFSPFALFSFWVAFYIILTALFDAAFFFGESFLINPLIAITMAFIPLVIVGAFSWTRST